jgi:hypothetical protein
MTVMRQTSCFRHRPINRTAAFESQLRDVEEVTYNRASTAWSAWHNCGLLRLQENDVLKSIHESSEGRARFVQFQEF